MTFEELQAKYPIGTTIGLKSVSRKVLIMGHVNEKGDRIIEMQDHLAMMRSKIENIGVATGMIGLIVWDGVPDPGYDQPFGITEDYYIVPYSHIEE